MHFQYVPPKKKTLEIFWDQLDQSDNKTEFFLCVIQGKKKIQRIEMKRENSLRDGSEHSGNEAQLYKESKES